MSERPPLSRERIAAAALAFIDEHGQDALSMRKLGAELGVEAMSLYNHVANKDDLLDAVGNLLYAEILELYRPEPDWTWQQDARLLANVYRQAAHRHPNALGLLVDRLLPSEVKYLFLARCYEVFTKAGFDTKAAALAFDTTASWTIGAIRQEMGMMAQLEAQAPLIDRESLPEELHVVHDFSEACLAWSPTQRFDFGFETMLAGLEAQLAAQT